MPHRCTDEGGTCRSAVSRSVRHAMTERPSRTNQRQTSGDWRPATYTCDNLYSPDKNQ